MWCCVRAGPNRVREGEVFEIFGESLVGELLACCVAVIAEPLRPTCVGGRTRKGTLCQIRAGSK